MILFTFYSSTICDLLEIENSFFSGSFDVKSFLITFHCFFEFFNHLLCWNDLSANYNDFLLIKFFNVFFFDHIFCKLIEQLTNCFLVFPKAVLNERNTVRKKKKKLIIQFFFFFFFSSIFFFTDDFDRYRALS